MGPVRDEQDIRADGRLYRVVLSSRYLTSKGGRERPTSDWLKDSNYENSCFVEGEISLDEIYRLFSTEYPEMRTVVMPVSLIRGEGFWIERRPDEAPDGCSNPRSHVVIGPPARRNGEALENDDRQRWSSYEKVGKRIVTSHGVDILPVRKS
jgi:hypothetical protein